MYLVHWPIAMNVRVVYKVPGIHYTDGGAGGGGPFLKCPSVNYVDPITKV